VTDAKSFDPTADLTACQAMAQEFEAYLKSDVLYWQMDASRPGGDQLPKLTVSGFLERAYRLRAASLSPAQQTDLEQASRLFEQAREAYRTRYAARVVHDLRGRVDAWQWFLDDYTKNPEGQAPYYPAQAHTRLAIELLLDELSGQPEAAEFQQRLSTLDKRLRAGWIAGEFVWPSSLAHAFPRDKFWWLYGRLRQDE
jgi:hypothetical protein